MLGLPLTSVRVLTSVPQNALARYFGEERPDHHAIKRELMRAPKTKASMLLRDPFWRSQLHGGERAPPHARHMRPMCVTVSSGKPIHAFPVLARIPVDFLLQKLR